MTYENELFLALSAVETAAGLCRQVQQNLVSAETLVKKDRSPVTIADLASQAVIDLVLSADFPDDPIVGEEDSGLLRNHPRIADQVLDLVNAVMPDAITIDGLMAAIDRGSSDPKGSGRFWTVDPIDGTKGFLRGDQYAVALALIQDGAVVVGVLGCPNLAFDDTDSAGCLVYALRGQGAWAKSLAGGPPRPVRVEQLADVTSARFCESVEHYHAAHDIHSRISALLGIRAPAHRIDSQVKYAAVARGDAAIYLRLPRTTTYRENIWDHAAGALIVEGAGGRVTDAMGKPLDFSTGIKLVNNTGILATNGHLHDPVLAAIAEVRAR
jgi:HAL2 family 3'(2'),5'-bisphosphate nucleotidase